jgi:hypothetical protein
MRDPEKNAAPEGIEERRIKIYRELVYNNIEGFIANSFPVLRKVIKDEQWHEMLRDYVARHQAHTPLFPKMPQEFIHYLEQERSEFSEQYPAFLLELAHYEWIESSISFDPREIDFQGVNKTADFLQGIPVMNQLALPLVYRWPVHKISPDYLPTEPPPEPTYIIVYRKTNDEVSFMVLNNVSARLIEKIKNNTDQTGQQMLSSISDELNHPDPNIVIKGGLDIMLDMHDKDILLGTKE